MCYIKSCNLIKSMYSGFDLNLSFFMYKALVRVLPLLYYTNSITMFMKLWIKALKLLQK